MSVQIFLGEPPAPIKQWILAHAGGVDPDPVDESDWGQLVATLEGCKPTEFNNLSYIGSDPILLAMNPGNGTKIPYKINGGDAKETTWINLGYNGSIPQYVKYRTPAKNNGWKHVWVSSLKSSLLAPIAVGDMAYVRTYAEMDKDFVYEEFEEVEAASAETFTYGNNCQYQVPLSITVDGKQYDFCGYNMTLNSQALLVNAMFDPDAPCFVKGTKILMANGTEKNVEDIDYGDELTVWDFDEGKLGTAPVCWLTMPGLKNDHYYKLTFSDGTVLKTTGKNSNHKIYNVDERFFKGVDKTEVGDRIWSKNGVVTVTAKEYIEEEVEYYNLITSEKINCFANGILASDRYGNMYEIDENMKYVKYDRPIRPYSEFELVGIDRYWYDNFRLGEQTESMAKTLEYLEKCMCYMKPLPKDSTKED